MALYSISQGVLNAPQLEGVADRGERLAGHMALGRHRLCSRVAPLSSPWGNHARPPDRGSSRVVWVRVNYAGISTREITAETLTQALGHSFHNSYFLSANL